MRRLFFAILIMMTMVTANSQTLTERQKAPIEREQSYLADVGGGVINVTFEPRCRNNWHIHHKQVQVLICVTGRGCNESIIYQRKSA